jgi:DNA-binding IclR family transcriptional regulator
MLTDILILPQPPNVIAFALRKAARGRLSELADAVRETVTLSVVAPDGGLDLVDQVAGPHHLVPRSWLGQQFPLHASSSGKILLSTYDDERLDRILRGPLPALTPHTITTRRALRHELEQVRARGYATTVDELEEGLAGVSVGIFGDSGLLGVLNVSGLNQRLDEAARRRAADYMHDLVDDIESALQRGRRAAA